MENSPSLGSISHHNPPPNACQLRAHNGNICIIHWPFDIFSPKQPQWGSENDSLNIQNVTLTYCSILFGFTWIRLVLPILIFIIIFAWICYWFRDVIHRKIFKNGTWRHCILILLISYLWKKCATKYFNGQCVIRWCMIRSCVNSC